MTELEDICPHSMKLTAKKGAHGDGWYQANSEILAYIKKCLIGDESFENKELLLSSCSDATVRSVMLSVIGRLVANESIDPRRDDD